MAFLTGYNFSNKFAKCVSRGYGDKSEEQNGGRHLHNIGSLEAGFQSTQETRANILVSCQRSEV